MAYCGIEALPIKQELIAYLLAPGLIVILTTSMLFGGIIGFDAAPTVSISELKSEISVSGVISKKVGFVVIVEPTAPEYRIKLGARATQIRSSLDEDTARANKNRLSFDANGVRAAPPFLGAPGPVTFLVDAPLGNEIQFPGRTERTKDLLLQSKRSISVVASALLACVFAFGMSSASIFPAAKRNQNATS